MLRRSAVTLPLVLTIAVALGGCADQALVDRVAQVEGAQDRLRSSLTELGAPDPDATAARDAAAAEVAALSSQLTDIEASIGAVQESLDAQVLELDGQLTESKLATADLRATLAQLTADVTTLTDRVSSLQAQFEAHRSDPLAHGG